MSSAESALIEDAENEQGVESKPKENILFRKDTKYSWFVCACAFFTQIFVLGVLHAFGVFFVAFVEEFKSSKGSTAWIGSLAYGLSMTFSPVTSQLLTRHSYAKVMMVGGAFCVVSLFVSSFMQSVTLLYITFSVFYGIGTCMCTAPTMIITPEYFDKYMSIATGITVSGSSFGTLIMGPLSQFIIDKAGWRTAFQIYAGLIVITIVLNSKIRAPPAVKQRRLEGRSFIKDMQIWKNRLFVIWTSAITLVMFGFYIPYVHLVSYAIDQGVSADLASLLMMILGGTTAVGRIMFGKIVQLGILNQLHMHQLSMIVTGAGVMVLPLIKSYAGIVLYVITVGLVDGCFVVLLPIMTTALMGIEKSVIAWGFLIGACSVTFTLGPPVAGALYDATGTYDIAFHCAGIPIVAGAVLLFLVPWAQRTSRSTNILSTEITLQGSSQDSNGCPYRTESGDTVCTEKVLNSVQIGSHMNVEVQTDLTSLYVTGYADKSTLTDDASLHQVSLDLSDTLSQLSHNSRVFDDMIQRSLSGSKSQCSSPQTSNGIPRIPPPTPSKSSTTGDKTQTRSLPMKINYSNDSPKSPRSFQSVGRSCASNSSNQAECSSSNFGFVPEPENMEVKDDGVYTPPVPLGPSLNYSEQNTFNPITSSSSAVNTEFPAPSCQMFGITGSPLQPMPTGICDNKTHGKSQDDLSTASHTTVDEGPLKQESNFDQTISDQVNMLRETLKSPTPCSSRMEENIISQPVSVKSSKQTSPSESLTATNSATSNQMISNQSSLLSNSSNPFMQQEPGPSRSEAIKLIQDAMESDDTFQHEGKTQSDTSINQSESSKFDQDNQLTVIPGSNPFVCNPPSQSRTRLEDLFKPIGEDTVPRSNHSNEIVVTDPSNVVQPTVSQTSEIDVFKHLFEDDETND